MAASAIVERVRPATIALIGATATVAVLLLTIPATGPVDLLVGLAAAIVAGATGWTWRRAAVLQSLPLEVAPVAGAGVVDGTPVYRFRARLGRGRAFRDAVATVRFEPADGPGVDLEVVAPPRSACGPLTLIVRDPQDRARAAGTFHVHLRVVSGGRTWEAATRVRSEAVLAGRFDGIGIVGGRVAFDDRWSELRPELPEKRA